MKKSLRVICFMGLLAMVFTCTAFASSYSSTVSFAISCTGATRSFDGANLCYAANTSVDWVHADNDQYRVTLFRKKFIGKDEVGGKDLNRVGYNEADWSNVGAGNYWIYFSKANDNVTVTSNDVFIGNY